MPTRDLALQRVLSAPTWRARFFVAAANASAKLVEYMIRHDDSVGAELWMRRLRYFRAKSRPNNK